MWLLALLGCGGPPIEGGTLLMVSERDGHASAWQLPSRGGEAVRLDGVPGSSFPATPDPHSTHALLISTEDHPDMGHREQLWLVSLAGEEARSLAPPAQKIRNPSWSPNGDWLVFESDALSFRDLYRVNRDGTGLVRLTEAAHGSFEPDVGPSRIAFGTSRDGNAEIYTANHDGSDLRRLTTHPSDDLRPRWSPDGEQLAWASRRSGQLHVWLSDGLGEPRPLRRADSEAPDVEHVWSPAGDRLAVSVQTGPQKVEIHIVESATGAVLARLDGPGPDEHPAWSPSGDWLAFTSSREGAPAIFVARADGRGVRRLSEPVDADWLPRWIADR